MANPLEMGMVSPPAPVAPQAGNALQSVPMQQAASPAPDHAQTVAGLRHLDAVRDELTGLLNNPALGKSDLKSAIIEGATNLVSRRILRPAEAVMQLSQVPEQPLAQRKYIQQLMNQTVQAERAILAHHAIGFAGQGPMPTPSADSHFDDMKALGATYSK